MAATASGVNIPVTFSLTNTGSITLGLKKSVQLSQSPAEPGDAITYTLIISNSGSHNATDVTLQDSLPVGVSGPNLNQTVTVTAGHALTYTLSVTVTAAAGYGVPIINTASFSHPAGGGNDRAEFNIIADTTAPSFKVNPLITPTKDVSLTTPRPTFDWIDAIDSQSGVASYTLVISGSSGTQTVVVTTSGYIPTTDLANDTYTWTVQSHDAMGNSSGYVNPAASFIIAAPLAGEYSVYLPMTVKS